MFGKCVREFYIFCRRRRIFHCGTAMAARLDLLGTGTAIRLILCFGPEPFFCSLLVKAYRTAKMKAKILNRQSKVANSAIEPLRYHCDGLSQLCQLRKTRMEVY